MRAIVLEKFGGLDSLVYKDIPEPEPKAGASGRKGRKARSYAESGARGASSLSIARSDARPLPATGDPSSIGSTTGTNHADHRDESTPFCATQIAAG
jgi:hypothetical protein